MDNIMYNTMGEYLGLPFARNVKGGEWLGVIVSIKSKGGDCWHYDTGVVLDGNLLRWQITAQAHKMKKKIYMQVTLDKAAYTHGLDNQKVRIHIHALSCKERHVHLVLVRGIWTMVLWSMVLVQGILSDVLTPGIWSKVLVLSGFGPWYWVRPKTIKGGEDH